MEKFTSKNFKILMIAVVILLGVLVYGLNAGTSVFSNVFGTVSAPLLTAGTNTTGGAKEFLNLDGMSKEELKALYNDLSEENRKLREQLVDYYTLKDENASYENILSVKKAMPDLQLAAGSVVGRDPNDVFGDFTINCIRRRCRHHGNGRRRCCGGGLRRVKPRAVDFIRKDADRRHG